MPDAESLQWMIIMAVCAVVFVVSIARLVWVLSHGPSPSTSRQRTWSDPEPSVSTTNTVAAMSFLGTPDSGACVHASACDIAGSDSSCSSSNS